MSAQEFSSPGAHMASMSSGGSSSAGRSSVVYAPSYTGRGPGESGLSAGPGANINYNNINAGFSRSFDDMLSSAIERSERYNEKYMRYNNDLFNSAKEYDKYMSNTAIQRQVEDLKMAGLNPILASRLGGATYKGVNAPYLSISPSSALNSFLDFGSSMYQTDTQANTSLMTQKMQNDSQQFIASYNKVMDRVIAGDKHIYERDIVNLKGDIDSMLENLSHMNKRELQSLGFQNDKALKNYQYEIDKKYHYMKKYFNDNVNQVDNNWAYAGFVDFLEVVSGFVPFASGLLRGGNTYNFNN